MPVKKSVSSNSASTAEGTPAVPFEARLGELEEIVRQLEEGEKPLDESLTLYERGIAALKACHGALDQAEKRIRMLVKDAGGAPALEEAETEWAEEDGADDAGAAGDRAVRVQGTPAKVRSGSRPARRGAGEAASESPAPPPEGESLFGGPG